MTRTELFAIAEKHGFQRGKPLSEEARNKIEEEIRAWLESPVGQQYLAQAPRVHWEDSGQQGMRPMTVEDAVRALMQEIDMEVG